MSRTDTDCHHCRETCDRAHCVETFGPCCAACPHIDEHVALTAELDSWHPWLAEVVARAVALSVARAESEAA